MKRKAIIITAALALTFLVWAILYVNIGGTASDDLTNMLLGILQVPLILLLFGVQLFILTWLLGLTRFNTSQIRIRSGVALNYLEQAVRLNLPLSPLLAAAASSEPRWVGRKLLRMKELIESGAEITVALREAVPSTSRRAIALLTAAERTGRMGPELSRLVRDQRLGQQRNLGDRVFLRVYPIGMPIVIGTLVSMIMIFVIPKYMQLMRDFKIPQMPAPTRLLIDISNFLAPPTNGLIYILLLVVPCIVGYRFILNRFGVPGPFRQLLRNCDLADVCHVIAADLTGGLPMNTAVRNAAELPIGGIWQGRLLRWADRIESGQSSKDAATAESMPQLVAQLGNGAEGFAFLSNYYAGKFSRVLILLRGAAIPAMVFIFGTVVGTVALALFLPMIAMINKCMYTG